MYCVCLVPIIGWLTSIRVFAAGHGAGRKATARDTAESDLVQGQCPGSVPAKGRQVRVVVKILHRLGVEPDHDQTLLLR